MFNNIREYSQVVTVYADSWSEKNSILQIFVVDIIYEEWLTCYPSSFSFYEFFTGR
jgi:hypothetical protein